MQKAMKRAVDIAYRAKGFSEKLHQEGFIRRGDIVRETRAEQSWFAVVHYLTGQMRGDRPGNPTVARQRLQPGGRRPNV